MYMYGDAFCMYMYMYINCTCSEVARAIVCTMEPLIQDTPEMINRTHLAVPNTLFVQPLKSRHLTHKDTFFCVFVHHS